MSAKAIFWLSRLSPEGIKAGSFRVLFHLAHSHADDKDPRVACYPAQSTLMKRTGLSNGGLNNALNDLEAAGFIRRRRTTVAGTKKQRTYYILGCDYLMLQSLPDDIDDDANIDEITNSTALEFDRNKLQKIADQTPKKANNKLQPTGENNTNKNNTNTTTPAHERESEQQQVSKSEFSEGFWTDLLHTLRIDQHNPSKWWSGDKARQHIAGWLSAGLTEDQVLAVAKKSREKHDEAPDGPKALDAAMAAAALAPAAVTQSAPATDEQMAQFWAEKLRKGAFVAASSIAPRIADLMLRMGLVDQSHLRSRSIAFTYSAR